MLIGPALISSTDPGLSAEIALFQRAKADCVRIPIGVGFGNSPAVAAAFVAAGAELVVLNVERYWPRGARGDRPDGIEDEIAPYLPTIRAYPETRWVLELANEPDQVPGVPIAQARSWLLATLTGVKPTIALPNLRWAVSLPTMEAPTRQLLAHDGLGSVLDFVQVIATHLYGYEQLADGGNTQEIAILHDELVGTTLPIILTEAGIDDRGTPPAEKARRYLSWAATADPRVEAMCIWTLGNWMPEPTYNWTPELADVLGARSAQFESGPTPPAPTKPRTAAEAFAKIASFADTPTARYFPQTGHSIAYGFKAYWEHFGDVPAFGYPVSEEFTEDGIDVQYFEAAVMERHPGAVPEWFDVERRLLGSAEARRRGYIK